ncbi:N-acetylmuramoyl-L-alanine amidase [Paenalkalicoccus suaedae]|uniref:N-acetylmuramoyl-L-alanine amidase n=1 Tax=Paenalkalicoccus suaedae TaxID=2592382 RepID=A0A859FI03_9BACI|nr:N-acetylmuramoyl-L-alanine amidase [Paenalkalicoccus suaedae]QKS72709.1 N-acetylmuramoyl-L-alanine amidase [Paenalkalicoccus suaedae]
MRKLTLLMVALTMLFSLVGLSFAPQSAEASRFSDANQVEVLRLAEDGIVRGVAPNQFGPQQNVTRAEAAVMIARALGIEGRAGGNSFSDVPSTHWAGPQIAAMAERNLIGGYSDGTFQPNRTLSRQEMAAILGRTFNYESVRSSFFTDVPPSHYYYQSIRILGDSAITGGYPDGTFGPTRTINRLEFSLMMARTLYPEYRPEVASVGLSGSIAKGTVINSDTLNVRPDPSTSHAPLGAITRGTEVNIHEFVGTWALVSNDNIRGYVSTSYLSVTYPPGSGSLAGRVIMLDPGHGGSDPGAVANGLQEKEINLDVSLRTMRKLQNAGATVLMTRTTDVFPSLQDRVRMANNSNADIFISVHANAAASTSARGSETFYDTTYRAADSRRLAQELQVEMLDKLNTVNRGVKTQGFYVIRNTRIPSALVELGFMTNPAEAERMKTSAFREASAEALYQGIVNYYRR